MSLSKIKVVRRHPLAIIPTVATAGSAGFDLYSVVNCIVAPGGVQTINTGIRMQFPPGYFGKVFGRSELAMTQIDALGGVIDSDYRGDIMVIIQNHSKIPLKVHPGMKIAQIVCIPYVSPGIIEFPDLTKTMRGESGFGSSGN